ncbi:hypothetical protein [Conexibacter sp. CPCC 206217]|uniref:hypothetical protein n=1 Tax=Conexibacter sp. CPCC 206217 TaxID=3064574 RepID=UPI002723A602|nr:hypothetical protein [Conexibacter sp. CPCC 206217]MDO8214216.1 hypothetical protein [Conexibacter sp. CPCC 206217]
MTSRLLARLVTGPVAFLLAGTADLTVGWSRWALARARERATRARARLPFGTR